MKKFWKILELLCAVLGTIAAFLNYQESSILAWILAIYAFLQVHINEDS